MRYAFRWWETLGKSERIVAMSLVAGSVVAITNSTVWAIAASYMTKQKALVSIAKASHAEEPAASVTATANGHRSASAESGTGTPSANH